MGFRQTHVEVGEKDKASYVVFPDNELGKALYYAWRPMSHADAKLTGVGAHIGPHK